MKKNSNDQKPVTGSATGSEWDKNREASERGLMDTGKASGAARTAGPNDEAQRSDTSDEGQGAPGIQGQYAGNHDVPADKRPGKTAPRRADPDTMNLSGSSHVALGSRERDKFGRIVPGSKKSGR